MSEATKAAKSAARPREGECLERGREVAQTEQLANGADLVLDGRIEARHIEDDFRWSTREGRAVEDGELLGGARARGRRAQERRAVGLGFIACGGRLDDDLSQPVAR